MNKINLLTKIKSLYPNITDSEKNIADLVLNNPEDIYTLSIKDIARKSKVSLPTVFRFAQRLGFNGFKDFKVELIKDISVGFHISPEGIQDGSIEAVIKKVFEKEITNLKETLSNIDISAIKEAAEVIFHSNRISRRRYLWPERNRYPGKYTLYRPARNIHHQPGQSSF